jgi:hypothetical protein
LQVLGSGEWPHKKSYECDTDKHSPFTTPCASLVAGVVVLYIAETAPRKIRGRMIAGYQFFVTVGLLVASCVAYATADRMDSAAFRIPIGIQLLWGLILIVGM